MREISLTKGQVTIVDKEDYEKLSNYKWHLVVQRKHRSGYVYTGIEGHEIAMHRFLLGLPHGDKRQVDHINGNTLDNRRSNLRICSRPENMWNMSMRPSNTSGFKGVFRFRSKWASQITVHRKVICLDVYVDPRVAAIVYDTAAIHHYGEFARTNGSLGNFWKWEML